MGAMMEGRRAWIELDMDSLRHNAAVLRALLPPGCELMPAVKADAYGHGAAPIARELNRLGVQAFCVATAEEGAALRRQHIRGLILILGYTPPGQAALLRRYDLTQTVVDFEYAQYLNACGRSLRVHLGIDTGMHRLGERCENLERLCEICRMENLRVEGIFTHLCADDIDDEEGKAFTAGQAAAFYQAVRQLRAQGFPCPKTHILSSYGLLNYPELGGDYARIGIALYGMLSTREDSRRCRVDLRPVLSVRTRISSVRDLHGGERAGYGIAYTAEGERRIAALAIGYADGLPRALSCGTGSVLINGRRAPIIGKICMDQTMVDVTGIPSVRAGGTATVIGTDGGQTITACDIAEQTDTIANEILSRLGTRLERPAVSRQPS